MTADASAPGSAVSGVIRADAAHIVIRRPQAAPDTIRFIFSRPLDAVAVERRWPDDFDLSPADDGVEGLIRLPWALAGGPFSAIAVEDGAGREFQRGEAYDLHSLCAFSEEEAMAYYSVRATRPQDVETQFFAARQNRDQDFLDSGYRKFISIVFAYRALDLGGAERLQEAIDWIEAEQASGHWIVTDHPRTDSIQQSISALMALWHLDLALGRYASVVQRLDAFVDLMRGLERFQTYFAFNACRVMLLRAYLLVLEGRGEEASALCELNLHVYKQCCLQATMKPTQFKELREPHHAVLLSLDLYQSLRLKRRLMKSEPIFATANRVRTEPAVTRQATQFEALLEHARAIGRSRRRAERKAAALAEEAGSA